MKKIIASLLILSACVAGYAQKDKTTGWNAPVTIKGTVKITTASAPAGRNHFELFSIKPYAAKMMKFLVSADVNYIIKIKSKDKSFVDQKTKGSNYYIFQLPNTDSLTIQLVAMPAENKPVEFTYSYSISDTAKKMLDATKKPAEVFEQLLPLAVNKFEYLYNAGSKTRYPSIEYSNGLFFPLRAVCENGYVKQYTGMALDEKAAIKDNEEWNKKIKAWLKSYNITEVKKLNKEQLAAKSNYLFNEATEYTKKNAKGEILFVVSVYKTLDSEGYYTGVYISNK